MRLMLAWMKETAEPANNQGGPASKRKKAAKKTTPNETTYEPAHSLEELLELRQNKKAFTMFAKNFLKPACSTKWKAKRSQQNIKSLSEMVTVGDEAFVLLALENNWERWIDINNKSKNAHTASTRGDSKAIDSHTMPKCTHINKKRDDNTRGEAARVTWRGWNNDGMLRFNSLCKAVKRDRKNCAALDKTILAAIDPEEKSKRQKNRKRKRPPVAKAFVDSDDDETDDDASNSEDSDGNEESESESSSGSEE